ncbi:ATP-dependent DNA ligase LigD ligase module /ATP-dependent DNA ligase LigD phosphoesterase module /ATP-dependent DNA ligase LigD polymerase module [Curtobacterium sp. PhB142]|uniref:ATP-dependent DNA ligase n=1 Tax=unclassified Curtobacterium TaxID=257496 RepID=UPI00104CE07B|nr:MULTISPECIES: ATP-dependent DNA ligase [unclassified Curtobacterium]TCL88281.1 ATP-dependent DNA ligase LigD ligase module /ATP-dependent DNA ligase LigD phosphoesterase module /ATP-dependent DNA ligase LigD polymerase module [Curtobacterium sp. PhB142]TCM04356.1 ATP-dependent DNA ligase LigD ligase module /ATP-dependent DNA ligase LigD phosphoesterase module /ATP-dependent DNA ligase LigD polymerase module [Curtobacterium sp. PhB134]
MSPAARKTVVLVGDRRLALTNTDKVLYPETGTTKGRVIEYYERVAPWMIPHVKDRPVTRKRWANGVDGKVFFEKNLPDSAPDWVRHHTIHHSEHDNEYPIVDDLPTLVWMAQQAALELHVPQWRFGPRGGQQNPDRLVLDLDPGEGVGLPECVEVAVAAREILHGMGLDPYPVTSGSKGIHLYAALDGRSTTANVSDVAHELAKALEHDLPDLVLSSMSRAERTGKVFVDWSQNNGNKTTIAPYSLRGRERPTVAAPRTWKELEERGLAQLTLDEVLERLQAHGDHLHPVASASLAVGRDDHGHWDSDRTERANEAEQPARDRLTAYRAKRDASKTPEPVPEGAPTVRKDGTPTFVIQEHHATRDHYDFRLEHDGVLVSWAFPKGEPTDPGKNHLAVQTEDHPLEYGAFEGTIPKDEYGGGTVTLWDDGTYELEKWRESEEVIVTLHGRTGGARRLALLHTRGRGGAGDEKNWLIHRTKEQPDKLADAGGATDAGRASRPSAAHRDGQRRISGASPADTAPGDRRTMQATLAKDAPRLDPADWAFEMKWDGVRALATVRDGSVTLRSRNDNDLTEQYPELQELGDRAGVDGVFDGEIVAFDDRGRPSFQLLQNRMGLTKAREVRAAQQTTPVRFLLFDVLEADGHELTRLAYDARRQALETVVEPGGAIDVPPASQGDLDGVMASSQEQGLEGVVAKKRSSKYAEGRRSEAWLKLKHHATQEVVVGGWKPGSGRRAGGIGSLLLGVPGPDGLEYVGKVGTGFRDRDLDEIAAALRPLDRKTSPFVDVPRIDARDAHWVTPKRVGEVEFAEWTGDGRLRQPSWRGWRPDKDPEDVVREH